MVEILHLDVTIRKLFDETSLVAGIGNSRGASWH
jgi:hypothetical protein